MFVGVLPRNDWCDDILTKLSIAIVAAMPAKHSPDPSQIIEPKCFSRPTSCLHIQEQTHFQQNHFCQWSLILPLQKHCVCHFIYIHSFLGAYTYSTQYNISRHRNNGSVNIRAYIYPGKKESKK